MPYLGLIVALAIPVIDNLPPALAINALALGLIERDGLMILVGCALTVIALAVTATAGVAFIDALAKTVTRVF